ncbi:Hint domain-containing protein (plasmid) [Thioclava litoralis]|uniref:Hint domain-containing protein n=1 Tax=Thioclava litoralis TaxID=3076557 RepID=A0ABZ1E481_9RHOB|nr:Hint domain-containing protein [Thioclava sp. FTW29]
MANATLTGNSGANGATLTNAADGSGKPSQNQSDVTLQTSSATVTGTGRFYDVNFLGGNDTLVATNMPWVHPDSGSTIGFDNINMGTGNDLVELHRSAFYDTLDMGDGDDTLILDNSGGRDVVMGAGNDRVQLDMSQAGAASEEELAQKVGQAAIDLDGGTGSDTLNLVGDWTLTLAAGSITLDTNNDGIGDSVTNVLRSDQYGQVLGMPTVLSGTVRWGDTITLSNGDTVLAEATFSNFEALEAVCFAAGTRIATPQGEIAVEQLREGDLVTTRNGPRPIRWIGKRRLDLIDMMTNPKLLPIRIPAGAFGTGRPHSDLRVSPQHRLAVRSKIAERIFGTPEVLVPAKLLVGVGDIHIEGETQEIRYYHFMLDHHAVVMAEGMEAETLYPGLHALNFLTPDGRAEVLSLFPQLADPGHQAVPALPLVKNREARALVERHRRNAKPLWS